MTFDEVLQDLVNQSYDQIVNVAKNAFASTLTRLEEVFKENEVKAKAENFLAVAICTGLGVDGKLSAKEKQFASDLFGTEEDVLLNLVQEYYNDKAVNDLDEMVDCLPSDVKSGIVLICAAFLAVDETITKEEYAFLKKLIS